MEPGSGIAEILACAVVPVKFRWPVGISNVVKLTIEYVPPFGPTVTGPGLLVHENEGPAPLGVQEAKLLGDEPSGGKPVAFVPEYHAW